jgi:hypothetical protein
MTHPLRPLRAWPLAALLAGFAGVAPAARAEDPMPGAGADPAAPPANPAPAPDAPKDVVRLKDAQVELDRLKGYLKDKRADTEDIKSSIDAVAKAYHNLGPNLVADESGAMVEDKASFEKAATKFRDDAEEQLVKAFLLQKVKPNSETNERDDVNVKAAQVLGTLAKTDPAASKRVAPRLKDALAKVLDAKHRPATAVYDEAFKALALLNDHKHGLTYIQEEWIKYGNTGPEPDAIKAAYEALPLFREVPGARRHEIVKRTVIIFSSVETAAESNKDVKERAQKVVWDKVKAAVIKTLQEYSGNPKDAEGTATLATVREFQQWFRDHENPRKPPWADPK